MKKILFFVSLVLLVAIPVFAINTDDVYLGFGGQYSLTKEENSDFKPSSYTVSMYLDSFVNDYVGVYGTAGLKVPYVNGKTKFSDSSAYTSTGVEGRIPFTNDFSLLIGGGFSFDIVYLSSVTTLDSYWGGYIAIVNKSSLFLTTTNITGNVALSYSLGDALLFKLGVAVESPLYYYYSLRDEYSSRERTSDLNSSIAFKYVTSSPYMALSFAI